MRLSFKLTSLKLSPLREETIGFCLKRGFGQVVTCMTLYQDAMTPWEWHQPLADKAKEMGVFLFSSPFDETAVEFLEEVLDPAFT
jgi:N-acetylneuraminate synthase